LIVVQQIGDGNTVEIEKRCRILPAGGLGCPSASKKVPQDWGIRGLIGTISAASTKRIM
jgi:hypothetical protein